MWAKGLLLAVLPACSLIDAIQGSSNPFGNLIAPISPTCDVVLALSN